MLVSAPGLVATGPAAPPQELPAATPSKLPRWRGFNLLEKFYFSGKEVPYLEEDFRLIRKLGFNFVRLPVDYRGYIVAGDWEKFSETALAQIDQAVAWGEKYGVHVCLNLHRAPGYTVAQPPEPRVLWTDPEARRVAALHWGMFARRYKGVPAARLSFNLFNEPAEIPAASYVAVVETMLAAIRAEDPGRLVLCDGLAWGSKPVPEFVGMKVAMMTRGYQPFDLTHYRASWVGSRDWGAPPAWPAFDGTNGCLLGPSRPEASSPLVIDGPVAPGSLLDLVVGKVSARAVLVAAADAREIWRHEFTTGPGPGPWKRSEFKEQWQIYQCTYDEEFRIPLPDGARRLEIRCAEGDWATLRSVGVGGAQPDAPVVRVDLRDEWTKPRETLVYRPAQGVSAASLGTPVDAAWLRRTQIDPWREFEKAGGAVMVGEWGAYDKTPHEVILRWAEDNLRLWQEARWGWALWNFRGSFGILDSGREDVRYEDFEGHQLDRRLLDLLQRF